MSEQTIAEQAAELARTLPESSVLEYRNDIVNRDVGCFLNGERISRELFGELNRILQARHEQECAEQGHIVPTPRCTRCGTTHP